MSLTAALLLIVSAFTHAGWNYLSKREHPSLAYFLLANTIGVVCLLPIVAIYAHRLGDLPATVWWLAGLSGLLLSLYTAALAGAYRSGDMSVAYPLARSLPVILVALYSLLPTGSSTPGGWFWLGVICVVTGCIALPMRKFSQFRLGNYLNLCCLLAVLAALGIAGYTLVDDQALRYMRTVRPEPFSPLAATLVYLVVEAVCFCFWSAFMVAVSARGRRQFVRVLQGSKGAAALTGVAIYMTYGLVLASMNYVSNVSYVAAFRQISIPLGASMGVLLLKEPAYAPKITAVAVILVGLVMVSVG